MAKDIPDWLTRGGRPSFMAIGDSLLNGMRSYTMNDALAAASIPALVGASFAPAAGFAPFVRAKYPRPVLLDAEADLHAVLDPLPRVLPAPILLVSLLAHLGDIKAGVAANARAWLDRFAKATAGPATFDNLAIAGAVLGDVFDRTYGDLEKRLTAMEPVIRAGDDPLRWSGGDPVEAGNWGLGEVHVTVNARHLLNPSNQADVAGLRGMTVADVVAARRPRVLLVCLGANHGLVDVVMRGRGEAGMRGLEAFAADWPRCAKRLARVPDLEAVVVVNLPRPSQVPCLMPARADGEGVVEAAPPVPGGYFDAYVSALQPSSSGGGYSGDQVAAFDRRMDGVNASVRGATVEAFKARPEVAVSFVDLSELLDAHDFKHRRGPKLPGGASGAAYSNYTMANIGLFRPKLRGGICGYDGIHPTGIGYRYVAEAVRTRLPVAWAPKAIPVTDDGDDFITAPHWSTLQMLDGFYPYGVGPGAAAAEGVAEAEEADRLLFRPPWLR